METRTYLCLSCHAFGFYNERPGWRFDTSRPESACHRLRRRKRRENIRSSFHLYFVSQKRFTSRWSNRCKSLRTSSWCCTCTLIGRIKQLLQKVLLLCKNKPHERLVWHKKGKTIQGNSLHGVHNFLAFQLRQPKLHCLDQTPQEVLCFSTCSKLKPPALFSREADLITFCRNGKYVPVRLAFARSSKLACSKMLNKKPRHQRGKKKKNRQASLPPWLISNRLITKDGTTHQKQCLQAPAHPNRFARGFTLKLPLASLRIHSSLAELFSALAGSLLASRLRTNTHYIVYSVVEFKPGASS